jgi:hypothetical protein
MVGLTVRVTVGLTFRMMVLVAILERLGLEFGDEVVIGGV